MKVGKFSRDIMKLILLSIISSIKEKIWREKEYIPHTDKLTS